MIPQGALVLLCVLLAAGPALFVYRMYQAAGADAYFRATDFRAFYSAGQIVAAGHGAELYDLQEQYSWQALTVGLADFEQLLPYFNPPFAALPFALLSRLPLQQAYGAWTLINLALFALIGILLSDLLRRARNTVRIAAVIMTLTFMPAVVTLVQGQWSLLLTAGLLLSWRALRDDRDLQAGLWLGVLAVKPQLLLLPAAALLWQRRWRAVGGLTMSCSIAVGALAGGRRKPWHHCLRQAFSRPQHNGETASASIRRRCTPCAGWHMPCSAPMMQTQVLALWAAGIGLVLGLLWYGWRHNRRPDQINLALQWAMLVIAALLLSPHANSHDLSLLIVAGVLSSLALTEAPDHDPVQALLAALTPLGFALLSLTVLINPPWRVHVVVIFLVLALMVLAVRMHTTKAALRRDCKP